jgi:hypothetical protein
MSDVTRQGLRSTVRTGWGRACQEAAPAAAGDGTGASLLTDEEFLGLLGLQPPYLVSEAAPVLDKGLNSCYQLKVRGMNRAARMLGGEDSDEVIETVGSVSCVLHMKEFGRACGEEPSCVVAGRSEEDWAEGKAAVSASRRSNHARHWAGQVSGDEVSGVVDVRGRGEEALCPAAGSIAAGACSKGSALLDTGDLMTRVTAVNREEEGKRRRCRKQHVLIGERDDGRGRCKADQNVQENGHDDRVMTGTRKVVAGVDMETWGKSLTCDALRAGAAPDVHEEPRSTDPGNKSMKDAVGCRVGEADNEVWRAAISLGGESWGVDGSFPADVGEVDGLGNFMMQV